MGAQTYRLIWQEPVPWDGQRATNSSKTPLFCPLMTGDRVPRELRGYFTKDVDGREETFESVARLLALGVAIPGTVEVLGPLVEATDTTPRCREIVEAWFAEPRWHLEAAGRGGVDARYAHSILGGDGRGVRVVDVESGWFLEGERRLPQIHPRWMVSGNTGSRVHGTAVLGLLAGRDPSRKVEGVVPAADLAVAQVLEEDVRYNVFNVIRMVAGLCERPAVLLVEREMSMPVGANGAVRGGLPVEAWKVGRAVLRHAVRRGVHCVVAAGNGSSDFDARGPRREDDSGAVLVGAHNGGVRHHGSNHGERIDVCGTGSRVLTLAPESDPRYPCGYTLLDGTSGAAAVVAGTVAAVCGVLRANGYDDLAPADLRRLLAATGSGPVDGVGPQPDLRAALSALRFRGYSLLPSPDRWTRFARRARLLTPTPSPTPSTPPACGPARRAC